MSNFSTQACYAVLSTYTSDGESPLQALLKMVVTLVDERKYAKIDPQDMVADFYKKYHFMQGISLLDFQKIIDRTLKMQYKPILEI